MYKIWNRTDNLVTPSGLVLTPDQVREKFPAVDVQGSKWIINDSVISMGVFMEFGATRDCYKNMGVPITDTMDDQQVLDAISEWEAHPPKALPTPEERRAASAELANILQLPVTTEPPFPASAETLRVYKENVEHGLWSPVMLQAAVKRGLLTQEQFNSIVHV